MKLWAIPDIHGRWDLLQLLWSKLVLQGLDLSQDVVIFLGDYVDRGPDSYNVVEFIKQKVEQYPDNVKAVSGNHEWISINHYVRKSYDDAWLFLNNGGKATELSYQLAGYDRMHDDHIRFLSKLPYQIIQDGFFFSHAPAPSEGYRNILYKGQEEFSKEELTWTYNEDEIGLGRRHKGLIGVCGHIHKLRKGIKEPRFYDHYYYLDSGCGCHPDAPLVAVDVKSKEVIYAKPEEL